MNKDNNYRLSKTDIRIDDSAIEFSKIQYLHDLKDDISHLKQLKFQVDCNNFFANLATIIDLSLQDKGAIKDKKYRSIFERIKNDLLYLQNNYEIIAKSANH